jgi:hypothetical protein
MTMHQLYKLHQFGFDNFGRWADHHRAMHAKHPLGCAEFGAEWLGLWEALGKLLGRRGQLEIFSDGMLVGSSGVSREISVAELIALAIEKPALRCLRRHVRILPGTIVKEWSAT